MVPSCRGRAVGLEPGVLDRDGIETPHALLLHGHTVQVALAPVPGAGHLPQLLAGVEHARVHPHALPVRGLLLLAAEEQPGAVDGPVPQVPEAGHAERRGRGGEEVLLEDLDAGVEFAALVALVAARGGADLGGLCALGGLAEEGGGRGEEADRGH